MLLASEALEFDQSELGTSSEPPPGALPAVHVMDALPAEATLPVGDLSTPQFYLNADARAAVASNGKTSFTISQAATRLTGGEAGWGTLGQPFTVTYAYRATAPAQMPDSATGFQPFNKAQIDQAELAIKAWSDVANIHFARVGAGDTGPGAYSDIAAILLGGYTGGVAGAAAFAMYPGSSMSTSSDGDLWVNATLSYNLNPTAGNYGGMVLVHELGHTIGLAHPSNYNAGANVTLTYAADAGYYEDDRQYTVMSYFSESNTGANFGGAYAASPLLDDIAAAQMEYGPNLNTRLGDTTYGFNSNADEPWFVATSAGSKLVFAVWDAGGANTFDFSGYAVSQQIDLREGFFSDVGGLVGNVAVALGTHIQNAVGGSGADLITGNGLDNVLNGGAGNDTLIGGAGADALDGGPGLDLAVYSGPRSAYLLAAGRNGAWSVADVRAASPDGVDAVRNVETLRFADTSLSLPDPVIALEVGLVLRLDPLAGAGASLAASLTSQLAAGSGTPLSIVASLVQSAEATSSVATTTYEFFTGRTPAAGGMDYLVAASGANPNNLNSPYYQGFGLENRYINFSVGLGRFGEGHDRFIAQYGSLDLLEATRQAYATVFGRAPTDAKLHALLDPTFLVDGVTMSRADYFAYYGGDGASGIGTKAAMVGWLLAEAVKADAGVYALSNDAYLTDVAAHDAPLGVDMVGLYNKPSFAYLGG
jgi:serralysin